MKNQFVFRNLHYPIENSDVVCKSDVDSEQNDSSTIRNTAHVDFKKNNVKVRFVKVNSLPAVREHFTMQFYIDEAISVSADESSLLRIDPDKT